jgi:ubiquitin-protein ligase
MSSKKLLLNQLVSMKKNPVWGICCELPDESDVFKWDVYIEGEKKKKF